jgi:hypothetical protein
VYGVESYLSEDEQPLWDAHQKAMGEHEQAVERHGQMMAQRMLQGAQDPEGAPANDSDMPEPPEAPTPPDVTWLERLRNKGAPRFLAIPPEDLIRDPDLESTEWSWVMVRRQANRWDLAAQFPKHADYIRAADPDKKQRLGLRRERARKEGSDQVEIFEFYHPPASGLEHGRWAVLVGEKVVHVGDMPYRRIPVHSMVPGHEFQEPYGYGASMDLLAIQQARDSIASIVVSNIEALGLQKIQTRRGAALPEVFQLEHGLICVQSDEEIQPLKLLESTETQEKALEWLRQEGELTSGINATTRGDAPPSIKSGVGQAFAHSMSIQANAPVQWSWGALLQSAASALIELYQDFATTPRVIEIAGKAKGYHVAQFLGDDLKGIRSVSVNLGNPLMRTTAGRAEVAQMFFDAKAITPPQYFELIETGRMEALTEAAESFRILLASENEKLRSGKDDENKPVEVLVSKYDRHHEHIPETVAILADPMIRYQPDVVQRVFAHLEAHRYWWAWLTQNEPDMAMALGIPPAPPSMTPIMPPPDAAAMGLQPIMPMPPMMPPGPGGPGAPPGPPGPPPGPGGPPGPRPPPQGPMPPEPSPKGPGLPQGAELPPEVAAQANRPGMTM